jgi:hypothetical protein
MTRQITSAESEAITAARLDAFQQADKFLAGWLAGINHVRQQRAAELEVADLLLADRQATLDRERADRLAYDETIAKRLQAIVEAL